MSSKNRRKLLRKINVNNIQYFWCVVDYDCDGDGSSRFQIWKNKQKIFEELICGVSITPKIVREKILNIEEVYLIDPPSGWKYGFPKELPKDYEKYTSEEFSKWLIQNGYPKEEIDSTFGEFVYRIIRK